MRRRGVPIGGRRKDGCLKGWGWSIGSRGRDARGKKGVWFFFFSFDRMEEYWAKKGYCSLVSQLSKSIFLELIP